MQKEKMPSAQMEQKTVIVTALIVIAIATAAIFIVGIDSLTFIAWAFAVASTSASMFTGLWIIKNPKYYPMSVSLFQRAIFQLVASLVLSIAVILLSRFEIFMLSPIVFGLVQAALFAVSAIQILALFNTNLRINETEIQIQDQCKTLRSLQLEVEQIYESAKATDFGEDLRKLAEALRFSDPVSDDTLTDIENDLVHTIDKLKHAVLEKDTVLISDLLNQARLCLNERNKKALANK